MNHHHDDKHLSPDELEDVRHRGDEELARLSFSRRSILQVGMAAAANAMVTGFALQGAQAAAAPNKDSIDPDKLLWLIGDHHVHTQWSYDAKYRIKDQLDAAEYFGCDWVVFTEHSNFVHADPGVFNSHKEIEAERKARKNLLIFQGLEWYIPAAEHGTVFVTGKNEAKILRAFELAYDGKLNGWEKPKVGSPEEAEQEKMAAAGIAWLGKQKAERKIDDVLVLATHPMRLGIDSPDEFRLWHDADPHVMIGMEGAPGAQGYPYGRNVGNGDMRGEYTHDPREDSYPGYKAEHMRPYGGWDWLTATVGGFWDSMLAEGRRFYITANSDAHLASWHTWRLGDYPKKPEYDNAKNENVQMKLLGGRRPHPIDTATGEVAGDLLIKNPDGSVGISGDLLRSPEDAKLYKDAQKVRAEIDAKTPEGEEPKYPEPLIDPQGGSDFWPGQFTRIHAGATERSYTAVMDALRAGRVWASHGQLIKSFIAKVSANGRVVTLGDTIEASKGGKITVELTIETATEPVKSIKMSPKEPKATDPTVGVEWVPELAFVDIIGGPITGPVADRETLRAPETRVLHTFKTKGQKGKLVLTHEFKDLKEDFYIRFRGSDGKRTGAGYHGADVDPHGPIMHDGTARAGNPWVDTWFCANPVFVKVVDPASPSSSPSATPAKAPSQPASRKPTPTTAPTADPGESSPPVKRPKLPNTGN